MSTLSASSLATMCLELRKAILETSRRALSEYGSKRQMMSDMSSSEKPEFCLPKRLGSTTF